MDMLKIGELKTFPEQLQSSYDNPQYVVALDIDLEKYNDITSNKNWMYIGMGFYDYQYCRNQVRMRTATIGFDNLSLEEQKIAAQYFVTEKTNRDKVFSEVEQYAFWPNLVYFTRETRIKRWMAAKNYISYYLSSDASFDIGKTTKYLSDDYMEYGLESYSIDGIPGLYDWIQSTSIYSGGTGFSAKTYWTQDHENKIMEIIRDGIY